jgi:hypothetical protein
MFWDIMKKEFELKKESYPAEFKPISFTMEEA